MFGKLAGLISPRIGLGIIRKQLESELNDFRKIHAPNDPPIIVSSFLMLIDNVKNTVMFTVKRKNYPYQEGQLLCKTITSMVQGELGDLATIEIIAINYTPDKVTLSCGYVKDGVKQQKEITL